ncbi:nucleic acid-binding protein [Histoplasma capsulatum G186AR]|uniref:Nucleic acid-binding protein n=1 Tax=Ajellomyces capsulatus (strain G186AR / H82 / ATCC MYA-2454 / RMSCC 2432) TaxID=447093 RepID=C0NG69_AJECG|nr:nucleic acid-binding protein [Histoplasma capsulatum G186AR]EEH10240.1 nucleic acid-binding protein [Histoplasma capsulatum G186AR]
MEPELKSRAISSTFFFLLLAALFTSSSSRSISLRHAAFRAITASPAAFAVKPGTLAALGPSLLRLSGQSTKVAFQQRWNWNSSSNGSEPYGRRSFQQTDRRNESQREREPLPIKPNETIYVGNLFFEVTAEDLKRDMAKFGTIYSVRIVYDSRGMSRGFAYVQFDSVEAAEAAISEMNMSIYEGRRIVVNYSTRNSAAPRTRASEPTKTLFIGNLSFEMTDRELNDLFRDIPNVDDVRVSVDKRTGRPRGFAHADFLDVESAKAAMEILKEKAPYGRPLRLDYSLNTKDMLASQNRGSRSPSSNPDEPFQAETTETENVTSEPAR